MKSDRHYGFRQPMEHWEFLIQREGLSTWQPIPAAAVAIETGRYRIVVRSSYTDTEVDIRIAHESTAEVPPKRRVQKRSRRTNSEGLMVVIPFTDFQPGIWEIRCRPDLITDLMGDTWQHALQLQVLPKSEAIATPTTSDPPLPDEIESLITELEELTSTIPTHPPEAISENSNPWASVFASKLENPHADALRLTLDQENLMARQGQSITLSGKVELPETAELSFEDAFTSPTVFVGELQIQMRDPQTGKAIASRQQKLPEQEIPFSFTCNIDIPPDCQTRLILGQVTLYETATVPEDSPLVLATQSFTITADLDDLLSAIADNLSGTDLLELRSESETLDLSPIDWVETPKSLPLIQFEPSAGLSLPPLLHRKKPAKAAAKPLELPSFSNRQPPKVTSKFELLSTDSTPKIEELSDRLPDIEEIPLPPTEPDFLINNETEAPVTSSTEIAQADTPDEFEAATLPVETETPSDETFSALRLEDRFLSRLWSLATDNELSASLKQLPPADLDATQPGLAANLSLFTITDAELTAMEIVVDDEPLEAAASGGISPKYYQIPEDELIPTPELEVPKGELIAGQPLRIRVKLPDILAQLGVKLWIEDPQTRSLLENPRWIIDFAPNGWEQIEAVVPVTVPFGCMEIRFAAVAIELQTQRESRKVSIERAAIPPNLPYLASKELDV